MTDRELREALERQIAYRLGGRVRSKRASVWHSAIDHICHAYYAQHWSVFGSTVYYPSTDVYDADAWASFKTLAKCYALMEAQKKDPVFWVKWCFPQGLAALALLSFVSPWWLLALAFLAPWPAPWRRNYLLQAHGVGVAIDVWTHGRHLPPAVLAARVRRVNDGYYLWPSRNTLDMVRRLSHFNDDAVSGRACRQSVAFRDVLFLLVKAGKYIPHAHSHIYNTYQRDLVVLEAQ